jgi:trans-2,3-dihydro-3-hydroxyanthranilate isomerase
MSRRLAFAQLDVFSSEPLAGNALAVFSDATGLSSDEMQNIARETNLSETTFIFPRDAATEREHGVRVRILRLRKNCHLQDIPPSALHSFCEERSRPPKLFSSECWPRACAL